MDHFRKIFWPTLEPIVEELWSHGHRVLFYAEGDWTPHLETFAELPEGSIIFHIDKTDLFEAHKKLGEKFCLSGGLPNYLLSFGTPEDVRRYCKKIIDNVASNGGYIMDASAIIQNDAKIENVKAMTDFTRIHGRYEGGASQDLENEQISSDEQDIEDSSLMRLQKKLRIKPGVCIPWNEKKKEIPQITGDESILERIWEEIESHGYMFIWQVLLSF